MTDGHTPSPPHSWPSYMETVVFACLHVNYLVLGNKQKTLFFFQKRVKCFSVVLFPKFLETVNKHFENNRGGVSNRNHEKNLGNSFFNKHVWKCGLGFKLLPNRLSEQSENVWGNIRIPYEPWLAVLLPLVPPPPRIILGLCLYGLPKNASTSHSYLLLKENI